MSKSAVSGGGNRLSLMDIMAIGNAAEQQAAAQQASAANAPAQPTPMSSADFYGSTYGRIGQPDQAYFNQFVLPGSQGYQQPPLQNPMAHYATKKAANLYDNTLIDERFDR